jgi:hypothetical protein
MGYSLRITIEDYLMAILQNDSTKLPPRKPGCYSSWLSDFAGDEPVSSLKHQIVYVGKTERAQIPSCYIALLNSSSTRLALLARDS